MNVICTTSLAAALLVLGPAATLSAHAMSVGYNLSINAPVFNSANGILNVPDFQLENTSDVASGAQITSFSLTIGDTDFNFDFVRIEAVFNDLGADLSSSLNTVGYANNGLGDDVLEYDFTGFDSGDIFRFEVDVDPDQGSPSQDFRDALFPTALVSVTFSTGTVLSQILNPAQSTATSFTLPQIETVPLPGALTLYLSAGLVGGGFAWRKARLRG